MGEIELPVGEYLRIASTRRAPGLALKHRRLSGGMVPVDQSDLRAMHDVDDGEPEKSPERRYESFDHDLGTIDPDSFPPCIQALSESLRAGEHMTHEARFALASFLSSAGLTSSQVVEYLGISNEFGKRETEYQVEHIEGSYDPPSCATMARQELCVGMVDRCETIGHPLQFYEGAKE